MTAFVGLFLPLFLVLGVWQLNRAEQKTQLLAQIESGREQVKTIPTDSEPLPYQRYRVRGALQADRVWLLDNRTYNGRVGYEVWVPLVSEEHWYLVSLGWVDGGADRNRLPAVSMPTEERDWVGQWRPLSDSIVLAESPLRAQWPQVVQQIKPIAMAEQMQRPPPRGLLQLEAGQVGVGPVVWKPTVMMPTRHRGYAVQWFAMAAALLLMYLYAGRKLAAD